MPALAGLRIVVTRAADDAEELARPLRELGAEAILLPVIGIEPPEDPARLRRAAAQANNYDWIIFTSANAIRAFAAELPHPARMCKAAVATVGAATRKAAEEQGFTVRITPEKYVSEFLVEAFHAEELKRRRILIPSTAAARDVVATELRKRGAHVTVVEAYRNVLPPEARHRAVAVFQEPYPEWVIFASSSAVDNLVRLVRADALLRVKIASIGPITSDTVRRHGLAVTAEARVHSIEGLVRALAQSASGAALQ